MQESLKGIDLVVEILDARIPISGRNPDFDDMFKDKVRLIVLNKSDLSSDKGNSMWIEYYNKEGFPTVAISSVKNDKNKILNFVKSHSKEIIKKYQDKGVKKTLRCMVVGIPNSGKSTFINMIAGKGKLKREDRPGVTRSNQWIKIDDYLEFMDTPGVLWPKLEVESHALNLAYVGSIKDIAFDVVELCGTFLEGRKDNLKTVIERYKLDEDIAKGSGYEILEAICKNRGFIFRKDDYDYERGANKVFEEFRNGTLGRVTLELPKDIDTAIEL